MQERGEDVDQYIEQAPVTDLRPIARVKALQRLMQSGRALAGQSCGGPRKPKVSYKRNIQSLLRSVPAQL